MDLRATVNLMTDEQKIKILGGKDNWTTYGDDELKIKPIKTSDGPNGLRVEISSKNIGMNESKPATCFPTASALSSTWNPDLIKEVGSLIGEEAAFNGVNVVLSPGINIKRNPLAGRNFEYYSEDPYLSGKLGAAMITGIQKNGTGACVKHFAANNQEYRRMTVNAIVDERALREIYLTPFEIAVKQAKPKALMTAYNRVNGEYANENRHLLSDVLRGEWQYDGVVISDWGGTNDCVKSVNAGADLHMPRSDYHEATLLNGLQNGTLDKDKLNASVERILRLSLETTKPFKAGESGVEYTYNRQVALKAAEESIVLLKNDGALPLNHFEPLQFIGSALENAPFEGAGSSRVNPMSRKNLFDTLFDYDLNVECVKGFDAFIPNKKKKKKKDALPIGGEVAVVFLSHPDFYETEGRDKPNFELPNEQISAYRSIRSLFRKVITVVISGSAVDLSPVLGSDAIFYCPLLGETQASAIINVLTGAVNPSGKLAETFPLGYESVPTKNGFGCDFTAEYRESVFVGYRYYEKAKVPVLFPFGHGLSYTSFLYSDAAVDKNGVSFYVQNVGDTDGYEVCQVYVSKPETKVYRPVKELKGFEKVYLRAGEKKKIFVPFDEYTFRYFNVQTNAFEVEAGSYKIFVASSSEDVRLSVTTLISGTTKVLPNALSPTYELAKIDNVTDDEFYGILGYVPKQEGYAFYKKNRIVITLNSTIKDLAYAKGLIPRAIGRHFKKKVLNARKLSAKKAGDYCMASDVPLRMAVGYLNFSPTNAEGLLDVCNGKFFKGVKKMLKRAKPRKN